MAKTSNYSIRFEERELNCVKTLEKLDSPQKVVNFVMAKYYFENRGRLDNLGAAISVNMDAFNESVGYFEKPLESPKNGQEKPKTIFDDYLAEILDAKNMKELENTGLAIKKEANLSFFDKEALYQKINEASENFFTD